MLSHTKDAHLDVNIVAKSLQTLILGGDMKDSWSEEERGCVENEQLV